MSDLIARSVFFALVRGRAASLDRVQISAFGAALGIAVRRRGAVVHPLRLVPARARLWSEHFSRHRAAQRGDRDGHLIVLVDDPPVKRPWLLLTYAAIDGFAQEVGVTRMAGRFLDEMQQNPAQREAPPAAKRLH